MKHVTVGEKSLLVGDVVADLLIDYARLLGDDAGADTVEVRAISGEGSATTATFLLNAGTTMLTETVESGVPAPDNGEAEEYLRQRIEELTTKRNPPPEDVAAQEVWNRERE